MKVLITVECYEDINLIYKMLENYAALVVVQCRPIFVSMAMQLLYSRYVAGPIEYVRSVSAIFPIPKPLPYKVNDLELLTRHGGAYRGINLCQLMTTG